MCTYNLAEYSQEASTTCPCLGIVDECSWGPKLIEDLEQLDEANKTKLTYLLSKVTCDLLKRKVHCCPITLECPDDKVKYCGLGDDNTMCKYCGVDETSCYNGVIKRSLNDVSLVFLKELPQNSLKNANLLNKMAQNVHFWSPCL